MIHEPAVALTDALLAVESGWFAISLARDEHADGPLRMPFIVLFGATAVSSGAGAALHGLTEDDFDPRRGLLWRLSLASIGIAALSSWFVAARLAGRNRRRVEALATLGHVPYLVLVATGERPYWVAVAGYMPASIAFGTGMVIRITDDDDRVPAAISLAGLVLTFGAAAVQVRKIGIGRLFNHNALYHTLQAAGTGLFYASAKRFLGRQQQSAPVVIGRYQVSRT